MRNKPSKPYNPSPSYRAVTALLAGFVGYLAFFLRQPSAFQLQAENGQVLNRLTDLLIMPALIQRVFGDGAQPLSVLDRVPLLIGVLAWLALSAMIGQPLVRLALGKVSRFESIAFSVLSGLAILSTGTLLVGLCGGLTSRIPLLVMLASLVAVSLILRFRMDATPTPDVPNQKTGVEDALSPDSIGGLWLTRLIPVATGALAITYVFGSMLPPWEFDVLEYHLQAPKEFLQSGGIRFIPHNIYANMPLGAEMHSLAAMVLAGGTNGWWWGGLIGKTTIGIYALLAALLAGTLTRRKFGKTVGWASAGLVLATPGCIHVSLAGLIDMAVGAYLIAMLAAIDRVWTAHQAGQGSNFGIFLVSLFAGAAGACKYPGLLFAVVPACLWAAYILIQTQGLRRKTSLAIYFTLGLTLTCLPWLLKNALQTGNPVYPLAYNQFGGLGLNEIRVEQWDRVHRPQAIGEASAYSFRALFRSGKQLILGSSFINPSLVFFSLLGGFFATKNRNKNWLWPWIALIGWIITVWWVATHRIDRFWLPAVPLMAVLASFGIWSVAKRTSSTATSGIALVGISFGLLQALSGGSPSDSRFFVSLAALESESTDAAPNDLITPCAWVNSNLHPSDVLLCIGDAKAYLYRVPIFYATCFNETPGQAWLAMPTPAEQRDNLRKAGISHVMIDWTEIGRYRSPGNYGFSDWPTPDQIDELIDSGVLTRLTTPFLPTDIDFLSVN